MINGAMQAHGERINTHKLTAKQVHEILQRYADGDVTQKELASEYHVSQPNIHAIVSGKTWRDVV